MFVGRDAEIANFRTALEDSAGKLVLICAPEGFGKSTLINELIRMAVHTPGIQAFPIRYEVRPDQTASETLQLVIAHATEIVQQETVLLGLSDIKRQQWAAFFDLFTFSVGPIGIQGFGTFLMKTAAVSFAPVAERFIRMLEELSDGLPENARLVLAFDADPDFAPNSEATWAHVTKNLPPKVVLIISQRLDGSLATGERFAQLLPAAWSLSGGELGPLTVPNVDAY